MALRGAARVVLRGAQGRIQGGGGGGGYGG